VFVVATVGILGVRVRSLLSIYRWLGPVNGSRSSKVTGIVLLIKISLVLLEISE